MIDTLMHAAHDNGRLAFVNGEIRRGCWECYHKIDIHNKREVRSECEVTRIDGQRLRLINIHCVPKDCAKAVRGWI